MKITQYLTIYLKGLAMGSADVVPGVSGGTVAFITGIYERLLQCISHVDRHLLHLVYKGQWKAAWKYMDGGFLLSLLLGIASAFLLLSRVILYLMEHQREAFWGAMAGLILASSLMVSRQLKKWHWHYLLPLIVGVLLAYAIIMATPGQTPNDLWFIFLSGMVAICAMILPGISGSFILVLLQKYEYMMVAIKEIHLLTIIVFISGCVVGLLSFARLLKLLFAKFHDYTVMVMTGFMLGSLVKLWPWKQVLSTYTTHSGEVAPLVEKNVFPHTYEALGMDPHLLLVTGLFFGALFGVLLLEWSVLQKKH